MAEEKLNCMCPAIHYKSACNAVSKHVFTVDCIGISRCARGEKDMNVDKELDSK
jgi:hypothetical protein